MSIEKLNLQRDFPDLKISPHQRKDIERFRWFSPAFRAKDPTRKNFIMDVRYSMVPNKIDPFGELSFA